jgi:hypothetical protein
MYVAETKSACHTKCSSNIMTCVLPLAAHQLAVIFALKRNAERSSSRMGSMAPPIPSIRRRDSAPRGPSTSPRSGFVIAAAIGGGGTDNRPRQSWRLSWAESGRQTNGAADRQTDR